MTSLPPSQGVLVRWGRRILDGDLGSSRRIERWFAGRGARRALVGAWAVVLLAGAVLPLVARLQDVLGPATVLGRTGVSLAADPFVLLALSTLLGFTIRAAVRRIADLPDEHIDERQIALRDRSHLVAYRIVATAVAMVLLSAYIVADARNVPPELVGPVGDWLMSDLFLVVLPLTAFLPSAVVAWYSQDVLEDDPLGSDDGA